MTGIIDFEILFCDACYRAGVIAANNPVAHAQWAVEHMHDEEKA